MDQQTQFVRVFGGAAVMDGDEPVSIGGHRQRRLLALLAARAGTVVGIDWLAEYLWDDDDRPEDAEPTLRQNVSRLRRALPAPADGWLQTEASGYRFDAPGDAIDVRRFGALRSEARRARERDDPQRALQLLDEALDLWIGDPYREIEGLPWVRAEIEQLHLSRLDALEERWEVSLALGRHTQITGELAAFTAEHGTRERAVRQYALALHRSGRTAEALVVIDTHRRSLLDQSGLDPSSELLELEQGILAGDPDLSAVRVGRPLRGYQLHEEIGSGAFSIVWRGTQPSIDRPVAIKQIRSELATRPEFIRRFEAEAQFVARIEHPFVVPLIDYWRDPDSAYLVMRWLDGGTLEERLDDGPLSIADALAMTAQVGSALAAAHARGIVHRDVKPANVLFDEAGHAYLSDFGIALPAEESDGPVAALSPGTPAYASPEQIRREPLDARADVFSLAVVLFEAIAGSLPAPSGTSAAGFIDWRLRESYPPLARVKTDVPSHVADAVARATANEPAERFESVEGFLRALAAPDVTAMPAGAPVNETLIAGLNPYLGLRSFDDVDAATFFGRERFVDQLVGRWRGSSVASRCLAVVGPSGSGKSSVVRAGLLPALRAGAVPGSEDWFITTMVPGERVYEALEAALLRVAVNPPPSLLSQLVDGPRGIVRAARRCLPADDSTIVIVIDQFEELFHQPPEVVERFLDALAVAIEQPTSPIRVVLTLRADYYGRPLEHAGFARIFSEAAVDVRPLAPDELERAIVEPARSVGVEFEPGLVARIAAETLRQPSPLPLLQHALAELFEHREGRLLSTDVYDVIGGLSGALAASAERIHGLADERQRLAIRRLFGALTDPDADGLDVRRRARLAEVGDDSATQWALEQYGAARLLAFDCEVDTREPTVEVAHEALFRAWPRLVGWLAEDAELLRRIRAVSAAATAWDGDDRAEADLYRGDRLAGALELASVADDRLRPVTHEFVVASAAAAQTERTVEQRRIRNLRRLVTGVGLALVIALVAGLFAIRQRNRAQEAADEAEVATLVSRSAAASADDDTLAILLALEANRRAPTAETEQAIYDALAATTSAALVSSAPISDEMFSGGCGLTLAGQGATMQFVQDGELGMMDTASGEITTHGPLPGDGCVTWLARPDLDARMALGTDDRTLWMGRFDGPWEIERRFDERVFTVPGTMPRATGPVVLVEESPDESVALVLDAASGDVIATVSGLATVRSAAVSDDGTVVAIGFGASLDSGDGMLVLLDGDGTQRHRVPIDSPPSIIRFDERTGELLAGTVAGDLLTIDGSTGAVTAAVGVVDNRPAMDLAVGSDGAVTMSFEDLVQVVDRQSGPLGSALDIPPARIALIREPGVVLTVPSSEAQALDSYALGSNLLAESVIEFVGPASVSFGEGQAIVANDGGAEVIDLRTDERTAIELIEPDGAPFQAVVGTPGPDGVLALDGSGAVFIWRDGERTDGRALNPTPGAFLGWGHNVGSHHIVTIVEPDGVERLYSLVVSEGTLEVRAEVPVNGPVMAAVGADLGFHVIELDGTLRSYNRDGVLLDEAATGWSWRFQDVSARPASDPSSGRVAFGSGTDLLLIDTVSGEASGATLPVPATNLSFTGDGRLLIVGGIDGTVRLWDIDRAEPGAVVWRGDASIEGGSWFDGDRNTLWVVGRGELIELSLDVSSLVERACEFVGRDLTDDEWTRFVPGDDAPQSACP